MKKTLLIIIGALMCSFALAADFPTLPNSFVARQLIQAAKVMANYNALLNGITDGTKKVNVNELWIDGVLTIDSNQTVTANVLVATTANISTLSGDITISGEISLTENAKATKNVVITPEMFTLNSGPSLNVHGNAPVLEFHSLSKKICYGSFVPPSNIDYSTSVNVNIFWAALDGSAGAVRWQMLWTQRDIGDAINASFTDGVNIADGTVSSAYALQIATANVWMNLITEDDKFFVFQLNRDRGVSTDTYTNTALLTAIEFVFTVKGL